ncbi:hypothetical protein C0989_010671 [Termitomyces sp. Mn162]|nr:hypothetical protein C0989_010671 [Termitomyces sp. Mn162]
MINLVRVLSMISSSSEVLFFTIWGRLKATTGVVVAVEEEVRHVEGPAEDGSTETAKVWGVDISKTVETPFAFSGGWDEDWRWKDEARALDIYRLFSLGHLKPVTSTHAL